MQYPVLPANSKTFNLASDFNYSPLYDIVWSFDYAISGNPDTEAGFTVFLTNANSLTGGNGGIDLGYSGLSSRDIIPTYGIQSGVSGAVIGVGFDTTGLFGVSAAIGTYVSRDGVKDHEVQKNSIAIRGGATSYAYNTLSFYTPITSIDSNFSIVENTLNYKTVRARLGNLGRTLYIDYRNNPSDAFINLVTQNVSLSVNVDTLYKVGLSFASPISSSDPNKVGIFYLKNFHVEGSPYIPLSSANCTGCNIPPVTAAPVESLCLSCIDPGPVCLIEPCGADVPEVNYPAPAESTVTYNTRVLSYMSEGSLAAINTCELTTCSNIATAYDLLNYGPALSVIQLNTILSRTTAFGYANSNHTVTLKLTAINDAWRLFDSSVNIYTGNTFEPTGSYTGITNLSVIYV